MGDRVAVLKDGLLQQVAAPRSLYDSRPTLSCDVHRIALHEHDSRCAERGRGVDG